LGFDVLGFPSSGHTASYSVARARCAQCELRVARQRAGLALSTAELRLLLKLLCVPRAGLFIAGSWPWCAWLRRVPATVGGPLRRTRLGVARRRFLRQRRRIPTRRLRGRGSWRMATA
jgi:hypothetical protein